MAMASEFSLTIRRLLVIYIIIVKNILSSLGDASSRNTFVLNLIHRDSYLSPLYDPNAIDGSFGRAAYLSQSLTAGINNNGNDMIGIDIRPKDDGSVFLAKISIGEPPIPQILLVDTGSSITWVRCEPCLNCGTHSFPLYDPAKSSSFDPILCGGQDCRTIGDSCNDQDGCTFQMEYEDGSNVTGTLIHEQLIFPTIGGGTHLTPISGIGCAHSVTAASAGLDNVSGILGLGRNGLTGQIGGKFSYCFGDVTDPNYGFNRLVIGDGANLDGDVLRASGYEHYFFVVMEGISVGDDRLDIDPFVFARDRGRHEGGVILDTGSTLIDLNKPAYDVLRDKVQSLASGMLTQVEYDPEMLCFTGRVDREVSDFPYVTFHFEGEVELVLGPRSFFLQAEPDVVCMAVATSSERMSVIGLMAQQGYNIGFDTVNGNVYIQSIDCSLYF